MEHRKFAAGELIFRTGDRSDCAYIIYSGSVEISVDKGGEQIALAKLGAGEVFGEMGLVDDKPRSADARAVSTTAVTSVDRSEFFDMLKQDPEFSAVFIAALVRRLRRMNRKLTAERSVTRRVLDALYG